MAMQQQLMMAQMMQQMEMQNQQAVTQAKVQGAGGKSPGGKKKSGTKGGRINQIASPGNMAGLQATNPTDLGHSMDGKFGLSAYS